MTVTLPLDIFTAICDLLEEYGERDLLLRIRRGIDEAGIAPWAEVGVSWTKVGEHEYLHEKEDLRARVYLHSGFWHWEITIPGRDLPVASGRGGAESEPDAELLSRAYVTMWASGYRSHRRVPVGVVDRAIDAALRSTPIVVPDRDVLDDAKSTDCGSVEGGE